jgi:hypothetical protein
MQKQIMQQQNLARGFETFCHVNMSGIYHTQLIAELSHHLLSLIADEN